MDFSFTDEQQQLRRSVREFAESEIAPHVMEWDESSQFPAELIPKLAEMGLLGVIFPEQYGGAGLGYIEYVTVRLRNSLASTAPIGIRSSRLTVPTVHESHSQIRHRRAAQEIRRAAHCAQGEETRMLVAHRAGSRLRRRRNAHRSDAQERRLDAQRFKNIHHQWPLPRQMFA